MKSNLRRLPRVALAAVLILACGERGGPLDPAAKREVGGPALVKASLPLGTDLLLTANTRVEIEEPDWIRELREISALFAQNPLGSTGPLDMEVQFELAPVAGTQPCWVIAIREAAWLDGGDGYKFDVSGPNDLPAVVQLLRVENGQVEDRTGQLLSASGKLRFLPDTKAWSLELDLIGVLMPAGQATIDDIGGAVAGGLEVGGTFLPALIREAEAEFQGDALHLVVESAIDHLDGGDFIRERVESAYHFTELEPLDANGHPIELRIIYALMPNGSDNPFYMRMFHPAAWQPDGTGGFKLAAAGSSLSAALQIVKGVDGQLTDLTAEIASVAASLVFDAVAKAWLLRVELTSDEVIAPMFHPMLGAHTVTLDGGESLLPAGLRESQVRLF